MSYGEALVFSYICPIFKMCCMKLPVAFTEYTRSLLGDSEYAALTGALGQDPSVAVRLNANKPCSLPWDRRPVPWCRDGYYLQQRPSFTFDPLFHAGAYYVQEASSMFLEQVLAQHLPDGPVVMLDLCAAPGGKSTHARALLPEGSLLVSNEVMRARAQVLAENLTKWGHPDVVVTNSDPADFASLTGMFDVVLTDVPCSGEGMFRKDEGAVADWSPENVALCWQRQRRIVGDVWPCLKPGGVLVYSTCTYNTAENEENVSWIARELGAEVLPVAVDPAWHITGNLLSGASFPVYRFLPHRTQGEGLFMAVLRKLDGGEPVWKAGGMERRAGKRIKTTREKKGQDGLPARGQMEMIHGWLDDEDGAYELLAQGERILAFPARWMALLQQLKSSLYLLQAGVAVAGQKGRDWVPCHALGVSTLLHRGAFPEVELADEDAIAYLRSEALQLPESSPRGILLVTYQGIPLGFVKNLGNRANNLYPSEWRIRKPR